MGVPIAWRNLLEARGRFVMSVGGVALAMLLILVLDGVFAGSMDQVTAYMDRTPFDLVVAQEGVKNLHMTVSFFPSSRLRDIERVPGVASVDSILYTSDFIARGDRRSVAYVIGFEPGRLGGPWAMAAGTDAPGDGGIIIDERVARAMDLGIGDTVTTVGKDFRIVGLTKGTVNIVNSIAFVDYQDLARALGVARTASYALVRLEPGADDEVVAARMRRAVDEVTVQTRAGFAQSERRIIADMSVDIMRMMNAFAFLIGLAVLGLTVYTATLAKLRDYGVLKALGAGDVRLYRVVAGQAAMSLAAGLAGALALAFGISAGLAYAQSTVSVLVQWPSVIRVVVSSLVIAALASAIPILRIAGVDPAEVFRR